MTLWVLGTGKLYYPTEAQLSYVLSLPKLYFDWEPPPSTQTKDGQYASSEHRDERSSSICVLPSGS